MSDPTILVHRKPPLEPGPTYIGECCREWVLSGLAKPGHCGLCGEVPTYKRADDGGPSS